MTEPPKNLAASIHRRLLNGARQRGEDFQLTLLRYGAERLLYRLSRSRHNERFVLKGALLFLLWPDQLYRPTRDIDLEGLGDSTPTTLETVFREIADVPCPDDGLRINRESVHAQEIRSAHEYGGIRITLSAFLGKAALRLQVDVGFGDAMTLTPDTVQFPTLLPLPAPILRTYPVETVVAEKFEAITRLGRANSRMKDFRDLLTLAGRREFDGKILTKAVRATFARRKTELDDLQGVLGPDFYADAALGQRWSTYRHTNAFDHPGAASFEYAGRELRRFLRPLADALRGGEAPKDWQPDSGWTSN